MTHFKGVDWDGRILPSWLITTVADHPSQAEGWGTHSNDEFRVGKRLQTPPAGRDDKGRAVTYFIGVDWDGKIATVVYPVR